MKPDVFPHYSHTIHDSARQSSSEDMDCSNEPIATGHSKKFIQEQSINQVAPMAVHDGQESSSTGDYLSKNLNQILSSSHDTAHSISNNNTTIHLDLPEHSGDSSTQSQGYITTTTSQNNQQDQQLFQFNSTTDTLFPQPLYSSITILSDFEDITTDLEDLDLASEQACTLVEDDTTASQNNESCAFDSDEGSVVSFDFTGDIAEPQSCSGQLGMQLYVPNANGYSYSGGFNINSN
jgi:hypothetical protein